MDDVVDDVDGYVSVTEIECRERTEHVWVSSPRFNLAGDLISQPRSNLDVYSACSPIGTDGLPSPWHMARRSPLPREEVRDTLSSELLD